MHGLGDQEGFFSCCLQGDVRLFLVLPSCGCSGGQGSAWGLTWHCWLFDHPASACLFPRLLRDPFSPPSWSVCSLPLASPSTGCGHSFPMGMQLGARGTGPAAGLAGGSLPAVRLPGNTQVQSGAEPEHLSGTCFPSSPKAAFIEHLCLSVLILRPQQLCSLCLHELFLY